MKLGVKEEVGVGLRRVMKWSWRDDYDQNALYEIIEEFL